MVNGDVHVAKAAESSEHWKVEVSFAVKLNIATALVDGFVGVEENVVSGATVSIIHVYVAGVASTLPAASVARTWKL